MHHIMHARFTHMRIAWSSLGATQSTLMLPHRSRDIDVQCRALGHEHSREFQCQPGARIPPHKGTLSSMPSSRLQIPAALGCTEGRVANKQCHSSALALPQPPSSRTLSSRRCRCVRRSNGQGGIHLEPNYPDGFGLPNAAQTRYLRPCPRGAHAHAHAALHMSTPRASADSFAAGAV